MVVDEKRFRRVALAVFGVSCDSECPVFPARRLLCASSHGSILPTHSRLPGYPHPPTPTQPPGAKWAAAPLAAATLRCFCALVLLLALNGTTEAYAHAVMSPAELAAANRALLLCSAGQTAATFALEPRLGPPGEDDTQLSFFLVSCAPLCLLRIPSSCFFRRDDVPEFPLLVSAGLILANALGMLIRIASSWRFARARHGAARDPLARGAPSFRCARVM